MGKNGKATYAIQSVEHAFDLLELFQGDDVELGVSDLGRRMCLSKNKIFRLLSTLEAWDYVEQNPRNGSYRLGFKAVGLRHALVRRLKKCEWARPMLVAVAQESRETVCYSVLNGSQMVIIDKVIGDHLLLASPEIGSRSPAHCTGAGKALLAALDPYLLDQYLSVGPLEQATPDTITDTERLRQELQEAAARGYAVGREELHVGMSGIGCVVRDHNGKGVAAVSFMGPTHRLTDKAWAEKHIPLLRELADRISVRRGFCRSGCGGALHGGINCRQEGLAAAEELLPMQTGEPCAEEGTAAAEEFFPDTRSRKIERGVARDALPLPALAAVSA